MEIKNRNALSIHYVPDNLPYREKEIDFIKTVLFPIANGIRVPNIIIYGNTGTGKTSVVKYIGKQVPAEVNFKYINAKFENTAYKVLSKVAGEEDKMGYTISHFIQKIKKNPKNTIVVLDEADFLKKDIDDVLYYLSRINEDLETHIAFILITNKINLKAQLDARTRSSLDERELFFKPYDAFQLRGILEERAKLVIGDQYDPTAIQKIAAVSAQDNGDARYALKLLSKAIEIAEQQNAEKLEISHVDRAIESLEFDLVSETIKTQPLNHQIALYTLAKMTLSKRGLIDDSGFIPIGELYNYYVQVSELVFKRKPKSSKRFKEYINELENLGVLSTTMLRRGSRDYTRLVRIGVNPKDVMKFFEQ